jgi:hypothetical protein
MPNIVRFPGIANPWAFVSQLCEIQALCLTIDRLARRLKEGRGTIEEIDATIRLVQEFAERLEFLLLQIREAADREG